MIRELPQPVLPPPQNGVPNDVDSKIREYINTFGILPPDLAVHTTRKNREDWPPTACEIADCSQAQMYVVMDEGRVISRKRGGSRRVDTLSLLRYIFSAPEAKPIPLKHDPLKNKRYRRGVRKPETRGDAPALEAAKGSRTADKRAGRPRRHQKEAATK
jgi:hypothetical protein